MKKLTKWFSAAVIVTAVLRPELEAAPTQDSLARTHSVAREIDNDKAKTIFVDETPHFDDLKKKDEKYHIHFYSTTKAPPPVPHRESFIDLLKYLEQTFDFIQVADKNDLLATDFFDESWYEWFKYIQYFRPFLERINAGSIENPADDAPISIWDEFLHSLMKKEDVYKVDSTDIDGDGDTENDITVQYTTLKFDPVGQLASKLWTFAREYGGLDNLHRWFKRVMKDIGDFTVSTPPTLADNGGDKSSEEEGEEKEDGAGFGIGGIISPEGVLLHTLYDPVVFGVNTILFIIYNSVFWGYFFKNSGIENLFADYPDIPLDGECLDGEECPPPECLEGEECPVPAECPEGEECPEDEAAAAAAAEGEGEGDGAAAQDGAAAGGGDTAAGGAVAGDAATAGGAAVAGDTAAAGGAAVAGGAAAAGGGAAPPPPPAPPSNFLPPGGGAAYGGGAATAGLPPPSENLLPPPPPGGAADVAYDLGATAIGGNRNDYYYYYDYDYADQINRKGESDVQARSHDPESHEDSVSSNYYSHVSYPSPEAYSLQDTNIFGIKY